MSDVNCEEVLAEVELYIDGELDPAKSLLLAEHLGGCGSCLDHADFRRRLKDIVARKCRGDETPEHLVTRVRESLRTNGSDQD